MPERLARPRAPGAGTRRSRRPRAACARRRRAPGPACPPRPCRPARRRARGGRPARRRPPSTPRCCRSRRRPRPWLPARTAWVTATVIPRSLKEPVGFSPSCLSARSSMAGVARDGVAPVEARVALGVRHGASAARRAAARGSATRRCLPPPRRRRGAARRSASAGPRPSRAGTARTERSPPQEHSTRGDSVGKLAPQWSHCRRIGRSRLHSSLAPRSIDRGHVARGREPGRAYDRSERRGHRVLPAVAAPGRGRRPRSAHRHAERPRGERGLSRLGVAGIERDARRARRCGPPSPRAISSPSPRSSPSTSPARDAACRHGVAARHGRAAGRRGPSRSRRRRTGSRRRGAATGERSRGRSAAARFRGRAPPRRGARAPRCRRGGRRRRPRPRARSSSRASRAEGGAEERVGGHGAGHRRGGAPPQPAGERQALLDRQLDPAAARPTPEDLGRGEGRGVARGVSGIRASETERTKTPGSSRRTADDPVAHPAIAMPRQSKPGPTFDVEPGAYAVARSIERTTISQKLRRGDWRGPRARSRAFATACYDALDDAPAAGPRRTPAPARRLHRERDAGARPPSASSSSRSSCSSTRSRACSPCSSRAARTSRRSCASS